MGSPYVSFACLPRIHIANPLTTLLTFSRSGFLGTCCDRGERRLQQVIYISVVWICVHSSDNGKLSVCREDSWRTVKLSLGQLLLCCFADMLNWSVHCFANESQCFWTTHFGVCLAFCVCWWSVCRADSWPALQSSLMCVWETERVASVNQPNT